ncbi:hypothetical protein W97_01530 [Coniosporium apollinis CBS 100218]|uniref:Major facilitator superfamily (MFS) profile domain-containing protein n=1 Tax=Coniosporium apollinis (strain CBS 100218) TaxID=1168221 RepID=R7YKG7_CONA1|nr:uncharacterized protein W97_01530 [Coniosporium apollinis CBS 100218]EON62309.1 hypothetical protein W97_01530 [Coniosporium apollinis CBS 100218]
MARSTDPEAAKDPASSYEALHTANGDQHNRSSDSDQTSVVSWDGPSDPANPFNWPTSRKWLITLTTCFITLIVGINATAIASAAEEINHEFGVSDEHFPHSYWPVCSWNVGAALVPLVALPLMENFGVRTGYLASYFVFIILCLPQAFAKNFATLIVTRFFTGGAASILENITGGIVSDIWQGGKARSLPVNLYIWALLAGVTVGPVIGGGIIHHLEWRWIFYIQLILYAVFFPPLFLIIREPRGPIILKKRAKHMRQETGKNMHTRAEKDAPSLPHLIRESVIRPLHMLTTEYVVFTFTLWSAFAFGTVFLFTQSITQVYTALYAWPPFLTGTVQSAVVIGQTVGLVVSLYQNRLYDASAKRNDETPGKPIPEVRLYLAIPGSFLGLTAGFFWFGWTSYADLPWILSAIGLGLVGFGIFTVVAAVSNYITDAYAKYAASGLAAIAFGENIFAAFMPLASKALYTALGLQWASSVLGFLALVLSFAPVVLMVWGPQIRKRSPFMREAGQD